jgi:hypothetical protein
MQMMFGALAQLSNYTAYNAAQPYTTEVLHNPPAVRAISLWQPWATLIALGLKRIETRHWYTAHRGALAIHASKHVERDIAAMVGRVPPFDVLADYGYRCFDDLPKGGIVAVVDMVGCTPTDVLVHSKLVGHPELAFGDYSAGRWGWVLENTRQVIAPLPVPCDGHQGIWVWRPEPQPLVLARLAPGAVGRFSEFGKAV